MSISRRIFLTRAARAAALAAVTASVPSLASAGAITGPSAEPTDGLAWDKAPCRFCGTGCGVMVGTKNGRVVAIQGDRDNPVNRGLLCVKGYHVGMALYGADRLTRPMLRKGGRLQPTSWDKAVDVVARAMMTDHDSFGIYGSGQWTITEGYTAMKMLKGGMGSNHLDPNARLCMASAVVGLVTSFGVDEPAGCYDDLDACDTVVCWGNNWAEMHPVLFSRFVDRRNKHEKITLIDISTRYTRSSEAADHYLEFVPHTDLAIANCICRQLLERGSWDKDFVASKVRFKANDGSDLSIDQYRDFLAAYTPDKVSKLSGLPFDAARP